MNATWDAGQDGPPSAPALVRPGKTTLLPGRGKIKAMEGFDRNLL
jgi:hypothetical protein